METLTRLLHATVAILHVLWTVFLLARYSEEQTFLYQHFPPITAPPYTFHCPLFSPTDTFVLFMEAKEMIDVGLGLCLSL